MEIIYILAAIASIIGTLIAFNLKIKRNKYAILLKIDGSMIKSKEDLFEIRKTISDVVKIKSDFSIKMINSQTLKVNLNDKKEYLSFLRMNEEIEKTNSSIENIYIESNKSKKTFVTSNKNIFEANETQSTPYIFIDKLKGEIHIKGISLPQDSLTFYKPIFDYLEEIQEYKLNKININIEFYYFNTVSNKTLAIIFNIINKIENNGTPVIINWYYLNEDEDMKEYGEDMKNIFNFKHFNVIKISDKT